MSRLSEKVAIVTGASKGIGAGIATALAAAGARVAVNYSSDRQGAERLAQAIIERGGEADLEANSGGHLFQSFSATPLRDTSSTTPNTKFREEILCNDFKMTT